MRHQQTDLTFLANDETGTLLARFKATLKKTRFFDVLRKHIRIVDEGQRQNTKQRAVRREIILSG